MSKSEVTWRKLSEDVETLAIKESYNIKQVISNCVVVPTVTSAIFAITEDERETSEDENGTIGEWDIFTHGRHGNPTRTFLEEYLAKIEGCKYALTFASGCAAINAILQTFLAAGTHVVSMKTIYSGVLCLFKDFERFGVSVDYVHGFTETAKDILSLITPKTKILWLESPVNPTMELVDIEDICQKVKAKFPQVIIVVDNTFLTPIFQRPLDLGADLTLYSGSKYLGGHADLCMGSIGINSKDLYTKLRHTQEYTGGIPSPIDCSSMIRSLKTLPIRMKQHSETALKVAHFLEKHPKVEKVNHPGLPTHPQHKLALQQQFGHSGAIGFYLKGGLKESNIFLRAIKVFVMAPSLGADISIANLPSKRSHAELPREVLQKIGITDNYIRLSVGLEGSDSLIADLDQALALL